jgi:acylphosphatase
LVDLGLNKTKVVLEFKFVGKGWIGLLMSGKVRSGIMGTSAEIVEELKYYMEKGKPHPNNSNK